MNVKRVVYGRVVHQRPFLDLAGLQRDHRAVRECDPVDCKLGGLVVYVGGGGYGLLRGTYVHVEAERPLLVDTDAGEGQLRIAGALVRGGLREGDRLGGRIDASHGDLRACRYAQAGDGHTIHHGRRNGLECNHVTALGVLAPGSDRLPCPIEVGHRPIRSLELRCREYRWQRRWWLFHLDRHHCERLVFRVVVCLVAVSIESGGHKAGPVVVLKIVDKVIGAGCGRRRHGHRQPCPGVDLCQRVGLQGVGAPIFFRTQGIEWRLELRAYGDGSVGTAVIPEQRRPPRIFSVDIRQAEVEAAVPADVCHRPNLRFSRSYSERREKLSVDVLPPREGNCPVYRIAYCIRGLRIPVAELSGYRVDPPCRQ